MKISALILNKLTASLPSQELKLEDFPHLANINLADASFNLPGQIDLIIGADYFFSILLLGQVVDSRSKLIAQNSIFGFLISGNLLKTNSAFRINIFELNIDYELKRFWEMEEIRGIEISQFTLEEQFCDTNFHDTHLINSKGRFVVRFPFYKSPENLGDSKPAAISRLISMEKKFKSNHEFDKQYKDFMYEYGQLGHMSLVNEGFFDASNGVKHYLPHHAVIKPSSSTIKLRVVFDG
ncbi:hypothetical protein AVEN_34216-1 [Araneus ventricosus]|uniref:Uncharacterized protein n=1 Tax=Araneus ventricosus TaxID=182803 RepID=A0A4Y2MIQ3_ARAVE|nr:hypothetical protein AVEN_34216-1 [Araneus ventricosus]